MFEQRGNIMNELMLPAPERYKDWRILTEDEKKGKATGEEVCIQYGSWIIDPDRIAKGHSLDLFEGSIVIVPPDYGKRHFDDLREVNYRFGDLDNDTQKRLCALHYTEVEFRYVSQEKWRNCCDHFAFSSGFPAPTIVYRQKRKEEQQEPERNEDGDSIEDMRKVQEEFGPQAVEYEACLGDGSYAGIFHPRGTFVNSGTGVKYNRIRAKHSDIFDPKCMRFATWARAAIDKGFALKCVRDWRTLWFQRLTNDGRLQVGFTDTGKGPIESVDGAFWCMDRESCPKILAEEKWTAITRAEYEQETAPVCKATEQTDMKIVKVSCFVEKLGMMRVPIEEVKRQMEGVE
jgi:hypothetical protein